MVMLGKVLFYVFMWCVAVFVLGFAFSGCASLLGTLEEVSQDVPAYMEDSSHINVAVGDILPEGIGVNGTSVAVGYGIAFLQRWYEKYKAKKGG